MIKNRLAAFAVLGVLITVFNVIMFVIPIEKTAVFWLSYAFTMFAFLLQIAVIADAFGNAHTVKSKFMGLPLFYAGVSYLMFQLMACVLFTLLASVIATWIVIITYVIILGFAFISLVLVDVGKDEILRVEEKVSGKVSYIKNLQIDVEMLSEQALDESLQGKLKSLAEIIKFSDPMSSDALADLEGKIENKINELKQFVSANDDSAMTLIDEVHLLLVERNKKCKLLK